MMNNGVGVVLGSSINEVAFKDEDNNELETNVDIYDLNAEENSKAEEDIKEEAIAVDALDPCTICWQMPCAWVSFGDSIVRSVMS